MLFLALTRLLSSMLLVGVPTSVLCDTRNWNPTGQGCVDSAGFLSCYTTQSDKAVSCEGFCDSSTTKGTGAYQDCILGCNGAWLASNLGCWIQSCWNQVYSCEYQLTALSYFDGTGLVQNGAIPFYPPPDNVSGGACSCNLGYVYGNKTFINFNNACLNVAGSGDFNALYECECCEFGFPVSNILNVCPKSDLSILGFQQELANTQQLIGKSTDNCAILDNNIDTCVTEFGYPFFGSITNPLNLPDGVPGTEPLSNLPGNAFTEFGAPTYTLQLFPGYSSIISPAAFDANAGVVTGSISVASAVVTATGVTTSRSGSAGATGTGSKMTASTSSPAAAAASSKSSGSKLVGGGLVTFLVFASGSLFI